MGKSGELLYSFSPVKNWILGFFFLACCNGYGEQNNVVRFDSHFVQRQCTDLFLPSKRQKPAEGALIAISSHIPKFVEQEQFFREMNGSTDTYFYNSGGQGTWTRQLQLSVSRQIYILRARRYFSPFGMDAQTWVQRLSALRENYKLVSYTKIEVPLMFHLLHKTIFFVRGTTSVWRGELYSPADMNFQPIVENGPLLDRLLEFIESWDARNQTELDVKETLKAMLKNHYSFNGNEFDADLFAFQVAQEIAPLFPPEFSTSLIDNL